MQVNCDYILSKEYMFQLSKMYLELQRHKFM